MVEAAPNSQEIGVNSTGLRASVFLSSVSSADIAWRKQRIHQSSFAEMVVNRLKVFFAAALRRLTVNFAWEGIVES